MFTGRKKNRKLKILIAALAVCLLAAILAALVLAGCTRKDEGKPAPGTTTSAGTTTEPPTSSTVDTTTTAPASPTASPTAEIPNDIPPYGWSLDSVNVRKTPNKWYQSIGGLYYGEKVTIIDRVEGQDGYWYKIKWNGIEAYVKAEYISPTEVIPIQTTAATTSPATTASVSE